MLWLLALIHSNPILAIECIRDESFKIRGLFPSGKVRIVQFRGQKSDHYDVNWRLVRHRLVAKTDNTLSLRFPFKLL